MHRAKGLEFDAVLAVAPASYLRDADKTADRRKLVYIALTRAKKDTMLILLG